MSRHVTTPGANRSLERCLSGGHLVGWLYRLAGSHRTRGMPMDGSRFDHWTRSLAVSRRGLLRGITAAVGGGLLGTIGLESVAARTCQSIGTVCRENAVCCTKYCGPKDKTGRRRCQCADPSDCPV